MSEACKTCSHYNPMDTNPDVARIDARLTTLESTVHEFMLEMRGMMNKPKDNSTIWQIVSILAMLMVAGVTAFYVIVTSSDKSLSQRIDAVEKGVAQKASADFLTARLEGVDQRFRRIEQEEIRSLLATALGKNPEKGFAGSYP